LEAALIWSTSTTSLALSKCRWIDLACPLKSVISSLACEGRTRHLLLFSFEAVGDFPYRRRSRKREGGEGSQRHACLCTVWPGARTRCLSFFFLKRTFLHLAQSQNDCRHHSRTRPGSGRGEIQVRALVSGFFLPSSHRSSPLASHRFHRYHRAAGDIIGPGTIQPDDGGYRKRA
jgi:hypothetical protein